MLDNTLKELNQLAISEFRTIDLQLQAMMSLWRQHHNIKSEEPARAVIEFEDVQPLTRGQKISAALKGRAKSRATKEKLSKSMKIYHAKRRINSNAKA